MSVIEVKVKNLKALKGEHTLSPDGKSFVVIGDMAQGKSTILNIIAAHMMQEDYPNFPLSEGENEGFTETVHLIDGIKYTISRKFKRKEDGSVQIDRFSVKSDKGGKYSLTDFLKNILSDSFTNNSKFDYSKFFFECKSSEARYKYLIDSIGGEEVYKNNQKIKDLENERAATGQQRSTQKTIWEQEGIFSPETAERDIEYYANEKTAEEAIKIKNEALSKRTEILSTAVIYNTVKETNNKHRQLSAKKNEIEFKIDQLRQQLHAATIELEDNEKELSQVVFSPERELELKAKIDSAESDNALIEKEANEKFNEAMSDITLFNTKRQNFQNTITAFRLWEKFDQEWNNTNAEIQLIRENSKTLFKNKLPIPELSIGDVNGKETVLYNGREFSWDNLSKGETIKITAQIQNAINPNGDNFIIIPEAQSLGSQIDEIIKECENFGMQAIIEYTERGEEFRMEFVEEFLTK